MAYYIQGTTIIKGGDAKRFRKNLLESLTKKDFFEILFDCR